LDCFSWGVGGCALLVDCPKFFHSTFFWYALRWLLRVHDVMLLLCIDPAIHACNLIQWWLPVGALPVVDILFVPHTAHQWHTTACVLCLLAVPILSHCVRHCLLLVTRRMMCPVLAGRTHPFALCTPLLAAGCTSHEATTKRIYKSWPPWATLSLVAAWVTSVHTSWSLDFNIFWALPMCPLLLVCTLAHTVPVILHYLTEKLCPPMWWPPQCYTLAARMPSVHKLCCLAAPAWYAIVRTCCFILFNCFR